MRLEGWLYGHQASLGGRVELCGCLNALSALLPHATCDLTNLVMS